MRTPCYVYISRRKRIFGVLNCVLIQFTVLLRWTGPAYCYMAFIITKIVIVIKSYNKVSRRRGFSFFCRLYTVYTLHCYVGTQL
jgi:hypothetical protein